MLAGGKFLIHCDGREPLVVGDNCEIGIGCFAAARGEGVLS
jgi:hypothetical protein